MQATYGTFGRGVDVDCVPQSCEIWRLAPAAEKHKVNPRNEETLGVTVTLKGQLRSRGAVIRESPSLDWTSENR